MTFAQELADARTRAGLSQADAASYVTTQGLKVALSTWETWERGLHEPPAAKRKRALEILRERVGGTDPLRPGYATEAQRRAEANRPMPDASPEPLAPPGVVLAFIIEDADGQPVWGYEPSGRAVQLGRAIRARASVSSPAPATE